jgi:hypothetical protein
VVSEEESLAFMGQFADVLRPVSFGREWMRVQIDVPIGPHYPEGDTNREQGKDLLDWQGDRLYVVLVRKGRVEDDSRKTRRE